MKALEHAKAVEHWVSGDAGIRGEECRAAAKELRRLAEVNAELIKALEKAEKALEIRCAFGDADECAIAIAKAKEQQ